MKTARAATLLGPTLALLVTGCGGSSPMAPATPVAAVPSPSPTPPPGPPNVIVILADDMGYGDLGSYGAKLIKTPNLDKLAAEGVRLTDFRVPSALCTPSRGALLTGLYPPRTGLVGNLPSGSPTEGDTDGIDDDEITIAQALRDRGYATAAVGKWHLGSTIPYLPTQHGFDSYFGISNGDQTFLLLRGITPVRDPPGLDQITRAYTDEAVSIVRNAAHDRPFFLYLAHRSPHVPLEPAPEFLGRSAGGLYGDVVEELDASVGDVMKAVHDRGTTERSTVVLFLSDNGPWLSQGDDAGSAGPFRAGKNTPYEGGVRVPFIAWWPGRYPAARVVNEPVMSLDLFPTIVAMAKGELSPSRKYYGADLTPLLAGEVSRLPGPGVDGSRELLGYYYGEAVSLRSGRWKFLRPGYWDLVDTLYDLQTDIAETTDVFPNRSDVAGPLDQRLAAIADEISQHAKKPKKGGGAN
ncbi:MAG TPA: sulfatase-like hydrolase/transferase [Vicinamibacteria bacterium]|nr:sulfatase-like hydrolase/transferase [Vicinamibacteria bacterium]